MSLYWWLTLSKASSVCVLFQVLGGVALIITLIATLVTGYFQDCEDSEEAEKAAKEIAKWGMIVLVVATSINVFIPSKRDLATMFGYDAIRSNNVQQVIELLKEKLK